MFQIDDGAGCAIAQDHQPLIVEEGLPLRTGATTYAGHWWKEAQVITEDNIV